MANITGVGTSVAIDDSGGTARTISDNIVAIPDAEIRSGVQDVTALNDSAMAREQLKADCRLGFRFAVDTASNKSHDVFRTRTGQRTVKVGYGSSSASGNRFLNLEALIESVSYAIGEDGSLYGTVTLMNSDGNEPTWTTS